MTRAPRQGFRHRSRVAAIALLLAVGAIAAAASARRGGEGRFARLSTDAWGATALEAPGRGRLALAGAPEARVVSVASSGARLRLGRFEDPPSRAFAGLVAR